MKKTISILCFCILAFACSDQQGTSPSKSAEVSSNSGNNGGTSGIGGSMARFTIAGDYLYIASHNTLYAFSIENGKQPVLKSKQDFNFFAETIFHINGTLLIGTQGGVMIYSLQNPASPSYESIYQHIVSCDPVVASGNYAYSTLRTESTCTRGVNRLDVIDISNIKNPTQLTSFNMTNPKGLGIAGERLYVCDGNEIKHYSLATPAFPEYAGIVANIDHCYDVIPVGDVLIISAGDGIYQYSIESNGNLTLLSKIEVE